jgi:hypothetical protein
MVAMLAIASPDATMDTCSQHAGPRAFASGVLSNGSCGYCSTSGALEACADGLVVGTVAYPGRANRSGCVGRWCLSCGPPIHPPPGAVVFVSPHCGFFDDAAGGVAPHADLRGALVNVSIVVAAVGVRLNGSLTLAGACSVVGGPLHIAADPPGCGVRLTNTPGHKTIATVVESVVHVTGGECGVSVGAAHWATGVVGTITIGSVRPGPSQRGPFFALATANVAGTVVSTSPANTAIMLDRSHTHRMAFDPPKNWAHVANLSAYLAVFGAEYEIEYFHDGERSIPTPPWVGKLAAANRMLWPVAAVFAVVIGRSAALAPAASSKTHTE